MRVIAGKARGKRLKAPAGNLTRPVTDMIKEALFDVWGEAVKGACVLDLFAGSGSVGIEALSRGAGKVILVDNSGSAVRVIQDNLRTCKIEEGFEVHRSDVFRAINILQKRDMKFNLIYIDPPFTNDKIFDEIMKTLDRTTLLHPDGIMVIRTFRKKMLPADLETLYEYRSNQYGESVLHYYRAHKEAQN